MSQRGAQRMAGTYGMDFTQILSFYYPGMVLKVAGADLLAGQKWETAGTGPARCAFSVGLELGDRPCAIAPMKPAYANASA